MFDYRNNQSLSIISTCFILIFGTGSYILYKRKKNQIKTDNDDNITNLTLSNESNILTINNTIISTLGQPHPSSILSEYEGCIYLDYNATSPIYPEVSNAMIPFLTNAFGNPSSNHVYGRKCYKALQIAREYVSQLINASNSETIYFTSCGTESDNRAIDIAIYNYISINHLIPHIITSSIEHPAIIKYLKHLFDKNLIELDIIPVDREGFINPIDIYKSCKINTILITIMHSNNEIGTIQPIKSISQCIDTFKTKNNLNHKILLHVDGAQSLGKVVIDVESLGIDMVTIVGHKFGAPKGVSALYIKDSLRICPMLIGGGQERGIRAGTENILLNVGLGEACRIAYNEADDILLHLLTLKQSLISKLISSFKYKTNDFLIFNGPSRSNDPIALSQDIKMFTSIINSTKKSYNNNSNIKSNKPINSLSYNRTIQDMIFQLPNTVSISFKNINSFILLDSLSNKVACSSGSACHVNESQYKISDVMIAIDIPEEYGLGTVRLSLGRHTTSYDIDTAVNHFVEAVNNYKY